MYFSVGSVSSCFTAEFLRRICCGLCIRSSIRILVLAMVLAPLVVVPLGGLCPAAGTNVNSFAPRAEPLSVFTTRFVPSFSRIFHGEVLRFGVNILFDQH